MGVLVVLVGEGEVEGVPFWPEVGESDRHALVVGGNWVPDALTVTTSNEERGGVADLVVYRVTLESAVDHITDHIKLFHFQGWPQHSEWQVPLLYPVSVEERCMNRQSNSFCIGKLSVQDES